MRSSLPRLFGACLTLWAAACDPQSNEDDPTLPVDTDARSQCGASWDAYEVSEYEGSAFMPQLSVDSVRHHVGQHVKVLGSELSSEGLEAATTEYRDHCSGTLVSPDLFLSAKHCNLKVGHRVRFNYQTSSEELRHLGLSPEVRADNYRIVEIVERGGGSDDYIIVRLDDSPGLLWGWAPPTPSLPAIGEVLALVGHPVAEPVLPPYTKKVSVGSVVSRDDAGSFRYRADSVGGFSGGGVFDREGKLVGLHVESGCGGLSGNRAISMQHLTNISPLLQDLAHSQIAGTPNSYDARSG